MTNAPDPRRVEYLPVAELAVDPHNPKAHADDVIDASIGRFGMLDPIVRDERTGQIISGHGRRKALAEREERGETPPEGVKVTDEGTWLVPVVVGWASRTDTEASAALIALNRTTELGGWVDEELLGLLEQITESGDENALEGVGFTEADREALEHLSYTMEEDGPRDLDDLFEEVGEPTADDGLRRVVLQLPPDVAAALSDQVGTTPADHLSAAEAWLKALEQE